ncbi:endolytic transglycosylase MltG [Candidatus Pacebacteria bacterium]|nr:endolytic transglycosylase MltG [Candidatus Paceibacterota bacterium]
MNKKLEKEKNINSASVSVNGKNEIVKDLIKAKVKIKMRDIFIGSLVILIALIGSSWLYFTSAPHNTELPVTLIIEEGDSLKETTHKLKDLGIIRSRTIANLAVIFSVGDGGVVSGEYLFELKEDLFSVMRRVTNGDFGIDALRVRIPEGATNEEIGIIFESRFENFDKEKFIKLTEDKEGHLFPDTYLFLKNVKTEELVETLEDNFYEKTNSIEEELIKSGMALEEIVIMASIIEKEATAEARQEVSNVLWNRMSIGMALQVDATFVYSVDKGTFDLTLEDLQDDSNPYNTYTHTGLPPTAIGNPSLEAIIAAANPQPTDNLYFLTGQDGEMYYAETFAGHKENRRLYLD